MCDMRVTEQIPNEWGGSYHYAGLVGRLRPDQGWMHPVLQNRVHVGWFLLNLKASPTTWKGVIVPPDQWLVDVQTPFLTKLNTWYHLESTMEGDDFRFYVDGVLVDSFRSDRLPVGRVGFCIGGCVAEFDNVVISGPDVPDIGPSGYLSVAPAGKLTTAWGRVKGE